MHLEIAILYTSTDHLAGRLFIKYSTFKRTVKT